MEPGGTHITQAGRGIQHDEIPVTNGQTCHGTQIWINHSSADRQVEPRPLRAMADEIPEVEVGAGSARVILGELNGVASPLTPVTSIQLWHLRLAEGQVFEKDVPATGFVYVLAGRVESAGPSSLIVFEPVDGVVRIQADSAAEVLVGAGTPHDEPVV
jgi:quercetin 2,3-dioxygenase